ncbi:MauE/DoxX family redox-associated membrane protein [Pedobacter roseus]|uniref:MauE/DoxX family redox-associated membrane protein n=1 Tax=Pedobacter roseus TaxID=336820 RepID=UPI003742EF15
MGCKKSKNHRIRVAIHTSIVSNFNRQSIVVRKCKKMEDIHLKKDKSKNTLLISVISAMLIMLWVYTAISKLTDLDSFQRQLYKQHLNRRLMDTMLWFLPVAEICNSMLLIWRKTQFWGMVFSSFLMTVFTGYISLVLLGFFEKVPCSCGGILKNLSWTAHFWFNVTFLLLSLIGTYYTLIDIKNLKKEV